MKVIKEHDGFLVTFVPEGEQLTYDDFMAAAFESLEAVDLYESDVNGRTVETVFICGKCTPGGINYRVRLDNHDVYNFNEGKKVSVVLC